MAAAGDGDQAGPAQAPPALPTMDDMINWNVTQLRAAVAANGIPDTIRMKKEVARAKLASLIAKKMADDAVAAAAAGDGASGDGGDGIADDTKDPSDEKTDTSSSAPAMCRTTRSRRQKTTAEESI